MTLGEIIFKNEKAQMNIGGVLWNIHRDIFIPDWMAGKSCEILILVERRGGYVEEFNLLMNGAHFYKRMPPVSNHAPQPISDKANDPDFVDDGYVPPKRKYKHKKGGADPNRKPATAPYNFIPLNPATELVFSDAETIRFDCYEKEKFTGYLDLSLTSCTPIFTRGEKEEFFKVDGKPTLPGSSLRGMVRNLVEIVSYGKFLAGQSFEDTRFYNRSAFDQKTLIREYYESRHANVKAGFLNYDRQGQSYYLLESARLPGRTKQSSQEFKYSVLHENEAWEVHSGQTGKKTKKQWIVYPPNDPPERHDLSQEDVEDFTFDRTRGTEGEMKNILDKCRKIKPQEYPHGLPIFFTSYFIKSEKGQKQRYAIGHTYFFRMPYGLTVSDHVPEDLARRDSKPDIANAIFGYAGDGPDDPVQAGRVFFEDAPLTNGKTTTSGFPRILSSPKPTSFQLYLNQARLGTKTREEDLEHWGVKNASIRGYKAYWHIRNEGKEAGKSWKQSSPTLKVDLLDDEKKAGQLIEQYPQFLQKGKVQKNQLKEIILKGNYSNYPKHLRDILEKAFFPKNGKTKAMFKPITPLPTGSKFKSRIRFENLSKVELGALLFVLDLEKGMAHKLGLGKPIGLGSIRIDPVLTLSNRTERYSTLFDQKGWNKADRRGVSPDDFKDAFATYMGIGLRKEAVKTAPDFWKLARLKDLASMLTFDDAKSTDAWVKRTAYGDLQNEKKVFTERHVLPSPNEFIQPGTFPD